MIKRLLPPMIVLGLSIGWRMSAADPATATEPPSHPVLAPGETPPLQTVLQRAGNGHFYVDAEVNGEMVHFLIDTGATAVALTQDDAERVGVAFDPSQFTVIAQGASGPVSGQIVSIGKIKIDQKEEFDVPGAVLDRGLGVSLLGQSFLSRIHSVSIDGDRMTLG